jgi:hypothetical protein
MLIIDGARYRLWTPKDEEREFHPMVREHFREIFGKQSMYLDIKHKLSSKSGIASIPDAYVIVYSEPYAWYIVEIELASHPVYTHIVPQVSKFVDAIERLETQRDLLKTLYNEIPESEYREMEKKTGALEPYQFLSELIYTPPRIALIIDEITPEVEQASKSLKKLANADVVQFKTYVKEDDPRSHAHLFEPIRSAETIAMNRVETKEGKRLPEHYENWEKMLAWVDTGTRDLVKLIDEKTKQSFRDVNGKIRGRYYCYYKGKPSGKSIFAALLLTKGFVKVRIRTNPATFKDPQKWTGDKKYNGWFFKQGVEREFRITNKEQLDYAFELITDSYSYAGDLLKK